MTDPLDVLRAPFTTVDPDPAFATDLRARLERAVAFYGAVLGWRVGPGSDPQGRQVLDRSPHLGLHGGHARSTLNCCYAVEDVLRAVERVRASGGRAGEAQPAPYGRVTGSVAVPPAARTRSTAAARSDTRHIGSVVACGCPPCRPPLPPTTCQPSSTPPAVKAQPRT